MRIITWRPLKEFGAKHPDAPSPLRAWYNAVSGADWSSFADVIAYHRKASQVGNRVVFNVGGNKYRMVVRVEYAKKLVFVRFIGTHQDYDRIDVSKA